MENIPFFFDFKNFAQKILRYPRRGIPPRQGRHWRISTIHRILRNETYAGVTYYNKHTSVEIEESGYRRVKNTGRRLRPKDQWIPIMLPGDLKIIERKTFEAAQKQLLKNSALSPKMWSTNICSGAFWDVDSVIPPYRGYLSMESSTTGAATGTEHFHFPKV